MNYSKRLNENSVIQQGEHLSKLFLYVCACTQVHNVRATVLYTQSGKRDPGVAVHLKASMCITNE